MSGCSNDELSASTKEFQFENLIYNMGVSNASEMPEQSNHTAGQICIDLVVGSFSGALGTVVGHPFDTIKVRMQMGALNQSSLQCLTSILQKEGCKFQN